VQSVDGVDQAVRRDKPVSYDVHAPLMSLPLILGITLDTLPARVPYVSVPSDDVARWRKSLGTGPSVGLVWRGHPSNSINARKSLPIDRVAEIVADTDVDWVVLQTDAEPAELETLAKATNRLKDYGREVVDWADTGALVSALDLVVSVDTGVAHLTGALGRPGWVLLSAVPDWRWLLDRDDSPWYPTLRLIRQPQPGDWRSVVENTRRRLAAWRGGGT
jgi:ADP-heptose:LPS heptosyltransferase